MQVQHLPPPDCEHDLELAHDYDLDQGQAFLLQQTLRGMQILTKSLLPLPDKYYGLSDVELRHRQR